LKILYLSCHSILEYDEVSLLHEMGHEVFSPGAYVEPANPGDASLRPSIPGLSYDKDILAKFHAIHDSYPGEDNKDHLTKELVDYFDCVIVMHLPRWIQKNWDVMKHKRVIWRTIGQSISNTERQLKPYRDQGMEIIRYSPRERTIPGYIGEDALIRFYKDPDEYGPWNGENKRVITFAQSMKQRDSACNFTIFEHVTRPYPRRLFGPGNEGYDWSTGKVPYEQLKKEMCDNRCYLYTGTHPASYTLNFIESWMSGIPIVAIGPKWGNGKSFRGHDLYEVGDLIQNYITGFVSDDPTELQQHVKLLLENDSVAKAISLQGRQAAIDFFGKKNIKKKWEEFLG